MNKHEYILLFEKHLAGQTSLEEERLLRDHQDDFDLKELPWDENGLGDEAKFRAELYDNLQRNINHRTIVKRINLKRWSIAAAVLLICSLGIYFAANQNKKLNVRPQLATQIAPGSNKAMLTLSDGSKVALGDAGLSDSITDGVATISNTGKGLLVYNTLTGRDGIKAVNLFNTVSTPRGGQFQVVLADGTKVWLNAASSLSFPTSFSGSERRVKLEGEAYFEVSKNTKMPFNVDVKGMTVKVLGTHFNIMAYADEPQINTTLLEGSVEISGNRQTYRLKPDEQATLRKSDNSIAIEKVNTAEFVAWKNGNFMFTDDNIEPIMRKIARWYDVDVSYRGNLSDKSFTGYISKEENISEVLKMLELTGTIHFKVDGRGVMVMP